MLRVRDERLELGNLFTDVVECLEVGTQGVSMFALFRVRLARAFRVRLARAFRVRLARAFRLARALGWRRGRVFLVVGERHGCLVLNQNEKKYLKRLLV